MPSTKAYRAALLHCLADPREVGIEQAHEYFEDGLLVVEDGKVARIGHAAELLPTLAAGTEVVEYPDALITPGFVDTHIHYPQVGVIGSYGAQLLDWLETYTFPNEGRFSDMAHARQQAELFLGELLRNGTTTALVFGTVHKQSVDAFFEACEKRNLRMIAGKVLMDRNAPEFLTDTAESGYADSRELIERWHGKGRLHYAVTPRFAPTSTPEQLTLAGKLFAEFPDLYMHTHISENKQEVEWVKELFPERKGYLDVYDHHGLIGPRSVFAHGIHLCDDECKRLGETGSAVSFCPTSNLFLGSGLFPIHQTWQKQVKMGLGTDIGAGTSFSQLRTISEAYKVQQLLEQNLSAYEALYHATLGGAKALDLDDKLGNFNIGKEADFIVLDLNATALQTLRQQHSKGLEDSLFALMTMGDERNIQATYIYGQCAYVRD